MEKNAEKSQYSVRKIAFALFAALLVVSCIADAILYLPGSVTVGGRISEAAKAPVHSVKTDQKWVALTFDTAGGQDDVQQILELLAKWNVRATFFLSGAWMENCPKQVKQIAAGGHEIGILGNAGLENDFSERAFRAELKELSGRAEELTREEPTLYRPSSEQTAQQLCGSAGTAGYSTILWSSDSEDWKDYGAEEIVKNVTQRGALKNGAILRFHCETRYTAAALEQLLGILENGGYETVTVSQLLGSGGQGVGETQDT